MVEEGLIEEAKQYELNSELNALNTVGYKELFPYFKQEYSKEKAIELIKRNSRRYAKRQITWFKRDETIKHFNPTDFGKIKEFILDKI